MQYYLDFTTTIFTNKVPRYTYTSGTYTNTSYGYTGTLFDLYFLNYGDYTTISLDKIFTYTLGLNDNIQKQIQKQTQNLLYTLDHVNNQTIKRIYDILDINEYISKSISFFNNEDLHTYDNIQKQIQKQTQNLLYTLDHVNNQTTKRTYDNFDINEYVIRNIINTKYENLYVSSNIYKNISVLNENILFLIDNTYKNISTFNIDIFNLHDNITAYKFTQRINFDEIFVNDIIQNFNIIKQKHDGINIFDNYIIYTNKNINNNIEIFDNIYKNIKTNEYDNLYIYDNVYIFNALLRTLYENIDFDEYVTFKTDKKIYSFKSINDYVVYKSNYFIDKQYNLNIDDNLNKKFSKYQYTNILYNDFLYLSQNKNIDVNVIFNDSILPILHNKLELVDGSNVMLFDFSQNKQTKYIYDTIEFSDITLHYGDEDLSSYLLLGDNIQSFLLSKDLYNTIILQDNAIIYYHKYINIDDNIITYSFIPTYIFKSYIDTLQLNDNVIVRKPIIHKKDINTTVLVNKLKSPTYSQYTYGDSSIQYSGWNVYDTYSYGYGIYGDEVITYGGLKIIKTSGYGDNNYTYGDTIISYGGNTYDIGYIAKGDYVQIHQNKEHIDNTTILDYTVIPKYSLYLTTNISSSDNIYKSINNTIKCTDKNSKINYSLHIYGDTLTTYDGNIKRCENGYGDLIINDNVNIYTGKQTTISSQTLTKYLILLYGFGIYGDSSGYYGLSKKETFDDYVYINNIKYIDDVLQIKSIPLLSKESNTKNIDDILFISDYTLRLLSNQKRIDIIIIEDIVNNNIIKKLYDSINIYDNIIYKQYKIHNIEDILAIQTTTNQLHRFRKFFGVKQFNNNYHIAKKHTNTLLK